MRKTTEVHPKIRQTCIDLKVKVHVFAGGLDWVDVGEGNVPAAALGDEGVVWLSPGPLLPALHHTGY